MSKHPDWLTRNARIVVTGGPEAGRHGRAVREYDGGPEWLVHLDGFMRGHTVHHRLLERER